MVKISVLPRCWINEISEGKIELTDWIDMATGFDCDGLEMYSLFLRSHDPGYLKSIRKRAGALGLSIPMMCHSPDFTIPERSARDLEVKKQIEMIKVISELGGKYCRILSGQARPDVSVADGKDWVIDSISKCLPHAEKNGVTIVIENHYKDGYWKYREFAQKKELFLEIINQIDSPYFGVQFDPSNATVAGDDPVDFLDKVILRVKTMHASDRYLAQGHEIIF